MLPSYTAFIHKDDDSVYGVSFPDFPGCISAGETLDEALANASEALGGHVRLMEADGDPTPKPRTLDDIMKDASLADEREGAEFFFVSPMNSAMSDRGHKRPLAS